MKNNISCVFRQGMAVLVAALMAFGTSSISRAAGAETGRYDGETLFRGLFFGIGPVADLFPEIWDSSVVRRYRESGQFLPETQSKAIESIIAQLIQDDPDFLARFSNDVQSGDQVRIENAVRDTAQRLYAMVPTGTESGGIESIYRSVTVAVDFVVVVEVAVAAVVAVAVAVVVVLVLGAGKDESSASNLKREFWIDLMADRLGPDAAATSN